MTDTVDKLTAPRGLPRQDVKIADLQPHPANHNRHPPEQIAKLANSLRTLGQVSAIVIWHNTILRGHGVVEAAKSLGWTEIRADAVDHFTDDEALTYLIADNELARQSDPDQVQLAELLKDMNEREPLLVEAAGYSTADLQELLRLVAEAEPPEDFTEYDEDIETQYCCPRCSYTWSGKPA